MTTIESLNEVFPEQGISKMINEMKMDMTYTDKSKKVLMNELNNLLHLAVMNENPDKDIKTNAFEILKDYKYHIYFKCYVRKDNYIWDQ